MANNQTPKISSTITSADLADLGISVSRTNQEPEEDSSFPAPPPLATESNVYGGNQDYEDTAVREDWQTLDFKDPAELIAFYDPQIQTGEVTLHPWQVDELENIGKANPTSKKPYYYYLCAANGSGKDAYVICPLVVWFSLCKIKTLTVITSSSGVQLSAQTENYIKSLCERINKFHGEEIFKIRQRYIFCRLSGSQIRLFATDEAGKAEGYHPLEANREMMIVTNESKSIDEEIFKALTRCTGYNFWIEVSTPGEPKGHFYRAVISDECYKETKERIWKGRRVTAFECPHLGQAYIDNAKLEYGEHSALYRSMILALFTSLEGTVIITQEMLNRQQEKQKHGFIPPSHQHWPKRVGLDLAAGGDENAITIVQGNKTIFEYYFIEKDTTVTAQMINQTLRAQGINKQHEFIFADDGGVGRAIIDMLIQFFNWNIKRVLNQHAAVNKKEFGNKGAENWFRVSRLVEECVVQLNPDNKKLLEQLVTRRYKQSSGATSRISLESKQEAKANGRPSPDRADSWILAYTGVTIKDFIENYNTDKPVVENKFMSAEELQESVFQQNLDGNFTGEVKQTNRAEDKKFNFSVSSLINNRKTNKILWQSQR